MHLAQFDVRSGKVLRGPARDDVPTYSVRVEGEYVYLQMPKQWRRKRMYFMYLLSSLEAAR